MRSRSLGVVVLGLGDGHLEPARVNGAQGGRDQLADCHPVELESAGTVVAPAPMYFQTADAPSVLFGRAPVKDTRGELIDQPDTLYLISCNGPLPLASCTFPRPLGTEPAWQLFFPIIQGWESAGGYVRIWTRAVKTMMGGEAELVRTGLGSNNLLARFGRRRDLLDAAHQQGPLRARNCHFLEMPQRGVLLCKGGMGNGARVTKVIPLVPELPDQAPKRALPVGRCRPKYITRLELHLGHRLITIPAGQGEFPYERTSKPAVNFK
ncbi:hypothetical protein EDB80DRAFT_783569 [Ilyonectria destructans]|nr:hypothetical protein EDB80DRAFT_783569 [Ilyonectria destructans]